MSMCAKRCCKAVLALGVLVLVAVVLDAAAAAMRSGVAAEAVALLAGGEGVGESESAGVGASAGESENAGVSESADDRLDVAREQVADDYGTLPEGFADEVLSVEGYEDVRANADGSVVGYSTDEAPQRAFAAVRNALVGRGWTAVPSGGETSGSFVKEAGPRTWAYVACVGVGDTTSVVVQFAITGEEG